MADKDIQLRDNGGNDKDVKMSNDASGGEPPVAPRRRAMVIS